MLAIAYALPDVWALMTRAAIAIQRRARGMATRTLLLQLHHEAQRLGVEPQEVYRCVIEHNIEHEIERSTQPPRQLYCMTARRTRLYDARTVPTGAAQAADDEDGAGSAQRGGGAAGAHGGPREPAAHPGACAAAGGGRGGRWA